MTEKLLSLEKSVPLADKPGYNLVCEYAFAGCNGPMEKDNFEKMCSVSRGKDCYYKTVRMFDLLIGENLL